MEYAADFEDDEKWPMPKIHGVGPGADPLQWPRRQGAPNNRSLVGAAGGDQYCTADHWQRYRRSGVASVRREKHCGQGDSGQPGEARACGAHAHLSRAIVGAKTATSAPRASSQARVSGEKYAQV
jgi:hypothetical protein